MFSISIYSTLSFPHGYSVADYVFFRAFPSLLTLPPSFLQQRVLEGSSYAKHDQCTYYSSFFVFFYKIFLFFSPICNTLFLTRSVDLLSSALKMNYLKKTRISFVLNLSVYNIIARPRKKNHSRLFTCANEFLKVAPNICSFTIAELPLHINVPISSPALSWKRPKTARASIALEFWVLSLKSPSYSIEHRIGF